MRGYKRAPSDKIKKIIKNRKKKKKYKKNRRRRKAKHEKKKGSTRAEEKAKRQREMDGRKDGVECVEKRPRRGVEVGAGM